MEKNRYDEIVSIMNKVHSHDKVHNHSSYMAKPQLYAIVRMAAELHERIEDGEELPDWAESHIAKCEQMMQSVYNKITYDKTYNKEGHHE